MKAFVQQKPVSNQKDTPKPMNPHISRQAVIALGSNLHAPQQQVLRALDAVAALPEILALQASPLYLSAPVGYADQPDFVNAVALAEVAACCTAPQLLQRLQGIEEQFGRVRSFRNAPRTLDLDLIDFNGEVCADADLILPHPRAHERSFVMHPLADIAPDYVLGAHGTAARLAAALGDGGLLRL